MSPYTIFIRYQHTLANIIAHKTQQYGLKLTFVHEETTNISSLAITISFSVTDACIFYMLILSQYVINIVTYCIHQIPSDCPGKVRFEPQRKRLGKSCNRYGKKQWCNSCMYSSIILDQTSPPHPDSIVNPWNITSITASHPSGGEFYTRDGVLVSSSTAAQVVLWWNRRHRIVQIISDRYQYSNTWSWVLKLRRVASGMMAVVLSFWILWATMIYLLTRHLVSIVVVDAGTQWSNKIFISEASRLFSAWFDSVALEMLHSGGSKVLSRCDLLTGVSSEGGVAVADLNFLVVRAIVQQKQRNLHALPTDFESRLRRALDQSLWDILARI